MKVLICGDRAYKNKGRIKFALQTLERLPDEIYQGGCSGADTLAREIGEELKIFVKEFPADWKTHGNSAGFKRNIEMLNHQPDQVFAFHDNFKSSKGTKHTVLESLRRNIPVLLFTKTDIYELLDLADYYAIMN